VDDTLIVIAMSVFIMDVFSFIVLFRISWPFNWYRAILFASLFILTSGLMIFSIWQKWDLFDISYPLLTLQHVISIAIIVVAMAVLYFFLDRSMVKMIKNSNLDGIIQEQIQMEENNDKNR